MFEFEKNVGLLITMHDEFNTVYNTLTHVVNDCRYIGIVQSGDEKVKEISELLESSESGGVISSYRTLNNFGDECSKWELPARTICRNYSALFNDYQAAVPTVDYLVCITGDTLLWNLWGIDAIISKMIDKGCNVGCARAFNQYLHSADLTYDHFELGGEGGGRLQDSSNDDFMPQMFIVGTI